MDNKELRQQVYDAIIVPGCVVIESRSRVF